MTFIRRILFILCLVSQAAVSSERVERLFWDKHPLKITLPVGVERMISFPEGVRAGIPTALAGKLRTQINQGTVYWLAKEPFDSKRIEVREIKGQHIYLIDLSAKKRPGLSATPIEVLVKQEQPLSRKSQHLAGPGRSKKRRRAPGYIALTRYAAQQLYAPKRLLKKVPGIHRVSLPRTSTRFLLHGLSLQATPLASWQSGRLYVTAVELVNTSDQPVELDPRDLRGQWRAATFHHHRLLPFGSDADTTAVYLISDRPFQEVL